MTDHSLASRSHTRYVSDLARVSEAFEGLNDFFSRPISNVDNSQDDDSVPRLGSITIVDYLSSSTNSHTYQARGDYSSEDRQSIVNILNSPNTQCKVRLVFFDYFREGWDNFYVGGDKDILGMLVMRYHIHPSILKLHFGSSYGLGASCGEEYGHTLSHMVQRQCLLLHYGDGFLTAVRAEPSAQDEFSTGMFTMSVLSRTVGTWWAYPLSLQVIVLARNCLLESYIDKLYTDLIFLDSKFPNLEDWDGCQSRWTNSIYLKHLALSGEKDMEFVKKNPMEALATYALMAAEISVADVYTWGQDVPTDSSSSDLTIQYNLQERQLQFVMLSDRSMRAFAGLSPSPRYKLALETFNSTLGEAQEAFNNTRLRMIYRASLASLRESRFNARYTQAATEQARSSSDRDRWMKMLTQLVFVFVLLTMIASLFGTKLSNLRSRSADILELIPAIMLGHIVITAAWVVFSTICQIFFPSIRIHW